MLLYPMANWEFSLIVLGVARIKVAQSEISAAVGDVDIHMYPGCSRLAQQNHCASIKPWLTFR